MPLILRSVKGSNLTPNEADGNFVYLDDRITSVTDNITSGVGVDSITISGNVLTFHMSDGSLETVTLPTAIYAWSPQGEWQPTTAYAVNDTVSYFGSLYLVIFAHTSDSAFDAGANDGFGHFFYALILPAAHVWGQTITSGTYTTLVTDINTYMRFTNAGGCAITIDPGVDYPAWSEMHFRDATGLSAAGISIECPTPGGINSVLLFNNATLCDGGTFTVKQVNDTGVWDIMGLLLPVTST
jgi:hypothetical protein